MNSEILKTYIYLVLLWFAAMLLFGFMGCANHPAKDDKQPAIQDSLKENKSEISHSWNKLAWGDKPWSDPLLKELVTKSFLSVTPQDYKEWCPNFPLLSVQNRAQFYAQLISIMAKRESGFNPASKYTEAFNDAKGKPVISRGLMQISIESANSYGCNFKDPQELHDPLKNLSCSVKIIERWVERDQRLGGKVAGKHFGIGRYWSVGRVSSRSYPIVNGYVKNLKMCSLN